VRSPFSLTKIILLLFIPLFVLFFLREFPYGVFLEPGSTAYLLYSGYLADVLQPFGMYFVLCLIETWLVWMNPGGKNTDRCASPSPPRAPAGLSSTRHPALPRSFDLLAYASGPSG
jgi:hypothetical protein